MLSGLRSADIVLPTTDKREIRLRRITTPTQEQQTLLAHLGIRSRNASILITNVVQTQRPISLILKDLPEF
jgi:hypothetical protein